MTDRTGNQPHATPGADPAAPAGLALVISPDESLRQRVRSLLLGTVEAVTEAPTSEAGLRLARSGNYTVVLLDDALPEGAANLCGQIASAVPNTIAPVSVVVVDPEPTVELAVAAIRAGASDLVAVPESGPSALAERVRAAMNTTPARSRPIDPDRERRLSRLCHKLNIAREEVAGQVGELAADLAGAYRSLTDQVGDIALASELDSIIRQELDVDGLLRATLEFLLARIGSTNAGVFLPGPEGDWSLGAYINYDLPRDAAEPLLDQLSISVAPAFANSTGVTRLDSPGDLADAADIDADWVEGRVALIAPSRGPAPSAADSVNEDPLDDRDHTDDGLAVFCVFRDEKAPFSTPDERLLRVTAELFGAQLARVIRIHHRGGPRDGDGYDDGYGSYDAGDDLAA